MMKALDTLKKVAGDIKPGGHAAADITTTITYKLSMDPVGKENLSLPPAEAYLVWSNYNRGWWRADSSGYTTHLEAAGIYTRAKAIDICRTRP